ncbi:MAG: aldo/keto reductase [Ignavibacteriales bacterium]|nr:MAG: aldo/keto reductase [Ignavibacteriales bacterium]
MEKIKISKTDLEVSRIILGCMQLGKTWNAEPISDDTIKNAINVIKTALDEGINFFDHADIYARGKSEEVFSHIWKEISGLRNKIILQSKCGIRFPNDPEDGSPGRYDFSYEHITKSVEGILRRLKTDFLDILLLHRPDPLVEPEEVAKAFDELHAAGKVRYFGLSNHTAPQIEYLKKFIAQPIIVNQLELSILHSDLIEEGVTFNQKHPSRGIRNIGTIEYCRLNDITIQSWAPLAKGKLFAENLTDEKLKIARDVVIASAEKYNVSKEAIMIAWVLRHPAKIQPVIGTTKAERVKACCQANKVQLSREDWYKLYIAGRGEALP